MSFYKNENGSLVCSPKFLITEEVVIKEGEHLDFNYPTINGWWWFENKEDAVKFLGVDYPTISDTLGEIPNRL